MRYAPVLGLHYGGVGTGPVLTLLCPNCRTPFAAPVLLLQQPGLRTEHDACATPFLVNPDTLRYVMAPTASAEVLACLRALCDTPV